MTPFVRVVSNDITITCLRVTLCHSNTPLRVDLLTPPRKHFQAQSVHDVAVAMPLEIADSDAESEFGSPVKKPQVTGHGREATSSPQASTSVIDFDQFLDATQRLSSSASARTNVIDQVDGVNGDNASLEITTGTAITQPTSYLTDMSPPANPKKRAHSALGNGSKDQSHESSSKKATSKRSKTYATSSRPRLAHFEDLFSTPLAPTQELNPSESTDQDVSNLQEPSTSSKELSCVDIDAQSGALPHGPSLTGATPLMTTSMASIGQYQSINLDFRGSAHGLDINANPFGSLSQVSLEDGPHQVPIENSMPRLECREGQSLFHPLHSIDPEALEPQLLPPIPQDLLDTPLTVNPAQLQNGDLADAENTSHDSEIPADATELTADSVLSSMEKAPTKKRGRKPKSSRVASKSPPPAQLDDVDELALPTPAPPNRSRLGTVDSVSQASEISTTNASTRKRKREKSKQVVQDNHADNPDSSPVKHPSSELHLSDEALIGLPKEGYKPRPSRSRSKAIEEEPPEPQPVESSPSKHPASEANLSDEAAIGLPKEAYKPKPSRSRSKKVVDEEPLGLDPPQEPKVEQRTPAEDTDLHITDETPTVAPSAKSTTKKGRKSKVKRAKTSAAALLKKTNPMLSEGEDDVVWMDSKPAPVKLELPPDLKRLKKESDPVEDKEKEEEKSHKATERKEASISIVIPKASEAKDPVVVPKKRGRKPKKAQQKSEEKIVNEEDAEKPDEKTDAASRPALAEKSTNTNVAAETRTPGRERRKTPTVSPLTTPEPDEAANPSHLHPPLASPAKTKENQQAKPLTTPEKPSTLTSEKGPTKHSPINPPNSVSASSGRKAIYRIGLSRRQNIPSLLRKVDRDKPPPKNVVIKQKEAKVKKNNDGYDGEDGDGGGNDPGEMRGPDGMLVEWEF